MAAADQCWEVLPINFCILGRIRDGQAEPRWRRSAVRLANKVARMATARLHVCRFFCCAITIQLLDRPQKHCSLSFRAQQPFVRAHSCMLSRNEGRSQNGTYGNDAQHVYKILLRDTSPVLGSTSRTQQPIPRGLAAIGASSNVQGCAALQRGSK